MNTSSRRLLRSESRERGQLPLLLVLPLGRVVHGELQHLALATQHGAAVPHAGDHQLDAVPQQRHRARGPRVDPRSYKDTRWDESGKKDKCGGRVGQKVQKNRTGHLTHTHTHTLETQHEY